MALKFRRGTAAQKSGSLAFGEPYVNTTLGTLEIGLDTGDVTLTAVGPTTQLAIQSISASAFISASSIRSTNGITGSIAATNGVVSGSSQITYTGISSIPGGIVSSSVQVLGGTGIVSGSSQITPLLPTGVISGSSQLNNASIENLTVINLTTVNETASVLFSSGSNTFGDFGNDTHNFTGSVKISGSLTTIGASTATSFNGIINATNGVVSGSSQITYTGISSIPAGIVSGSSQTIANLPTGTVSGSIQVLGGTGIVSGSSQITYTSISSIPGGIVSGSIQVLGGTGIVSGSSQITYTGISSIPGGIVSGSTQVTPLLPTGTVSGSSQVLGGTTIHSGSFFNGISVVSGSAQIDGSLLGSNKTITIGSTSTTLGGTSTTIAGLTSVTSTTFVGDLTGNVTGNASGTAATVTTAAQPAITSVGTLTTLTVSGATATGALTVTGAVTATGDITAFFTSDKRHKNNIQTIPNALEKVTKLNGVTWEWNDDVNEVTKSTPKTGLIAQEVQEVLPEVVKTRDDGFLALDYSKMMGLMVEAIKEQQQQIEKLRMDLDNYECKCDNCKSK